MTPPASCPVIGPVPNPMQTVPLAYTTRMATRAKCWLVVPTATIVWRPGATLSEMVNRTTAVPVDEAWTTINGVAVLLKLSTTDSPAAKLRRLRVTALPRATMPTLAIITADACVVAAAAATGAGAEPPVTTIAARDNWLRTQRSTVAGVANWLARDVG